MDLPYGPLIATGLVRELGERHGFSDDVIVFLADANDEMSAEKHPDTSLATLSALAAVSLMSQAEVRHRELGIPWEITTATLWDVGQQIALHNKRDGSGLLYSLFSRS